MVSHKNFASASNACPMPLLANILENDNKEIVMAAKINLMINCIVDISY